VTKPEEEIIRRRLHGLYLTRECRDITVLSRELLGLHAWFARNVQFSAILRGAEIAGWKDRLTKTWVFGALHGVCFDDIPNFLSLHSGDRVGRYYTWLAEEFGYDTINDIVAEVLSLMEEGYSSRTEFRAIFGQRYAPKVIDYVFSSWGGIFQYLARIGKVAFKDMLSRDFELISAEPTRTIEETYNDLLHRYFEAYGPATLADAHHMLKLWRDDIRHLEKPDLSDLSVIEYNGKTYYYAETDDDIADIPPIMILSGFDPYIAEYADRSFTLPQEYRKAVVLTSGIMLPTIAIDGKVAGLWNIKNNKPVVEFFETAPKLAHDIVCELVDTVRWKTALNA